MRARLRGLVPLRQYLCTRSRYHQLSFAFASLTLSLPKRNAHQLQELGEVEMQRQEQERLKALEAGPKINQWVSEMLTLTDVLDRPEVPGIRGKVRIGSRAE